MTYTEWRQAYPEAAAALHGVINAAHVPAPVPEEEAGKSEAWAQQAVRFDLAHQGATNWRNNVGATPAKCKHCGTKQVPVRYGLANESAAVNSKIKSSDVIAAIPRLIVPSMVGHTIAQFGSIEVKRPGWKYTGKDGEPQQAAWLALVNKIGGFAVFSTGRVQL